jgi:uncharacterized protein
MALEELEKKVERLRSILSGYDKALVAFSGGVDSTLLLTIAHEEVGEVVACTFRSPLFPDLEDACKIAEDLGVEHRIVELNLLEDENFASNPRDRCYYCKKKGALALLEIANRLDVPVVLYGTNYSDSFEHRPGSKALEEFDRVKQPLLDVGITKEEVRAIGKEMCLLNWNKPSSPCLATRIPYGEEISEEKLDRIRKAEKFLRGFCSGQIRVRSHGDIARIEVEESCLGVLSREREKVSSSLKKLGFTYVTLDLEGYRRVDS